MPTTPSTGCSSPRGGRRARGAPAASAPWSPAAAPAIDSEWIEAMPRSASWRSTASAPTRSTSNLARSRGIDVTTTPGVLTDDVADMGMALMLAVLRRIAEGDGFVRAGDWATGETFPLGGSLHGTPARHSRPRPDRQALAAGAPRSSAWRCATGTASRSPTSTCRGSPIAGRPSPRDSDVLAVCVAANAETKEHRRCGPADGARPVGASLINVARGSVVDEPALIAALQLRRRSPPPGSTSSRASPASATEFLSLAERRADPASGERHGRDAHRHGRDRAREPRGPFRRRPPTALVN